MQSAVPNFCARQSPSPSTSTTGAPSLGRDWLDRVYSLISAHIGRFILAKSDVSWEGRNLSSPSSRPLDSQFWSVTFSMVRDSLPFLGPPCASRLWCRHGRGASCFRTSKSSCSPPNCFPSSKGLPFWFSASERRPVYFETDYPRCRRHHKPDE